VPDKKRSEKMKVTSGSNAELNANKKIEKQPTTNRFDSQAIEGVTPNADTDKSDFASVLAKVTRSHRESQDQHAERGSTGDTGTRETKSRDEDKLEIDDAYAPAIDAAPARETVSSTAIRDDAVPILHATDVDSIVTACQVQIATNGRQEVMLELSHSMLEGLRVKVSADGAGRITADFLAANEGIKALLDSRSSELIEQLRARGITVAEFKSSVTADPNDRNDARHEQHPASAERIAGKTEVVAAAGETETTTNEDNLAAGATYRA
jgi:flagellar hook-length control protein FliK